jgi:hypothetical protein
MNRFGPRRLSLFLLSCECACVKMGGGKWYRYNIAQRPTVDADALFALCLVGSSCFFSNDILCCVRKHKRKILCGRKLIVCVWTHSVGHLHCNTYMQQQILISTAQKICCTMIFLSSLWVRPIVFGPRHMKEHR